VRLARAMGFLVYHTYDSRRCVPGFPDLVIAHENGALLFAELKMDGKYLRPDQKTWAKALGERFVLWRPKDWRAGTVEDRLRAMKTGRNG